MAYTETAIYVDSAQYANVAAWAATHAYTVGQIVRQLATPAVNNERCFICLVAGTSGSTEPSWSVSKGSAAAANTEGTLRWCECTGLPPINGDSVNVPVWKPAGAPVGGTIIKNTALTHYFMVLVAAGTLLTEPTWNTALGAQTTESTTTYVCIGPVGSWTTKWAAPCARLRLPLNNAATWLASADMKVFVGDDHAETNSSGSPIFTPASNCQIICIDHTATLPAGSGDLRTTASITEGGVSVTFLSLNSAYVYGLQIIGTVSVLIGAGGSRHCFEQCLFSRTDVATGIVGIAVGDSAGSGTVLEFKDCTFHLAAAGQSIAVRGGTVKWENCSLTGTFGGAGNPVFTSGLAAITNWVFEGSDLSNILSGSPLIGAVGSNVPNGYFLFKDCKLPASFLPYTTSDANIRETVTIDFVRCDSGGTSYRNERHTTRGTQTTSTAVARTNGASNGAHQIVPTVNASPFLRPFNALALAAPNTVVGASLNATIYGIANDIRVPTNDEVWFDAEYLGSASSPKGSFARGGKASPLAAATALTADTSAWDSAATARANSTAYVVGDVRKVASNPGRVFFCTGAGTSAASEPSSVNITWNPADKSAGIVLSNGNLTLSATAANSGARSTFPVTTGKTYYEVTWTGSSFGAASSSGCGFATSSAALSTLWGAGCVFVEVDNGNIWLNNANTGTSLAALSPGDVICLAIDLATLQGWFRKNSGNWNNSGIANPATGVGGMSLLSIFSVGTQVFASAMSQSSVAIATANFGTTAFAQTVPTGFVAWNAVYTTYAAATDGQIVSDGTAAFRAGCRFKQALTFTPQQPGYLYAYPKFARPSTTYVLDPVIYS